MEGPRRRSQLDQPSEKADVPPKHVMTRLGSEWSVDRTTSSHGQHPGRCATQKLPGSSPTGAGGGIGVGWQVRVLVGLVIILRC